MLDQIETVFLPTDFSDFAREALFYAAEIALRSGAKLKLLHCVEENIDFSPQEETRKKEILERVTASFEHLLDQLTQQDWYNGLATETKLLSGHPKVNILQEVEAEPASLIVMGTKGATAARKLLFGSLTTEIILHSSVPVLAIPEGTSYADFKNIVFATDYSREDLEKVHQAVEFARFFDAQLRIVHVASHESMETDIRFLGFQELVMRDHPDKEIRFDLKYEQDFFSGIADYIRVNDVDLLTMVRYKKSFWESLTTRNYSKELGFYTTIPLLVLMSPSED